MKDPAKTISNMRLALWIIGALVIVCNAHAVMQLWHEYHVDLGLAHEAEAHAATDTLHCSPPDDMGFMSCRGGP